MGSRHNEEKVEQEVVEVEVMVVAAPGEGGELSLEERWVFISGCLSVLAAL